MKIRTQYLSPELIAAIAYRGMDPAQDPRWQESGAATPQEYGTWSRHWCGMACLQMILDHRDGRAPLLLELARGCGRHGGYRQDPDGSIRGLHYTEFVAYARAEHGLNAAVQSELTLAQVRTDLDHGRMVIASVHKEIRRPARPAPGRGGHLVLIIGHDASTVHFRNPSGHTDTARDATLPVAVFETFFAHRGITVSLA